jgi:hypothetical protein
MPRIVTGPMTVSNFASVNALTRASVSTDPARSIVSRIIESTM